MRMYTVGFNKMSEVNDFVNSHGITKEQIVSIIESASGTWLLVYYDK